jgi:hypothetical protein
MSAQLGAMPRFIEELNEWKAGTVKPQPSTQLVLSDLHFVVGRLREYYSAHEIRTWLYARHPQLNGARAIDLINQNRSEDVLRILDRLDADVFL